MTLVTLQSAKALEFISELTPTILPHFGLKLPNHEYENPTQAFFRENSGSRDFGPNGPKMAQNDPKWPKNGGKSKISGKRL